MAGRDRIRGTGYRGDLARACAETAEADVSKRYPHHRPALPPAGHRRDPARRGRRRHPSALRGPADGGIPVVSVAALVIDVEVGMFGFQDSWSVPYATSTLYWEIVGAVLLLIASSALAWPAVATRSWRGR